MTHFIVSLVSVALLLVTAITTAVLPDGTWPTSKGSVKYDKPHVVKAGEIFDGAMKTYERSNVKCTEGEGQAESAVFLVEAGGTLENAIIGADQIEGVHCDQHNCTVRNVWWDAVCEDALSVKGGSVSSVTNVINCGARHAKDKVVQHNGPGLVKITGFFAHEFGKLYRSCGTCGDIARKVILEDVYAIDPGVSVITVNKNYNDEATLKNIHVKTTKEKDSVKVCEWSQGSKKPSSLGHGPSGKLCQFSESEVHLNEDISKAAQSPSSDDPSQTAVQEPVEEPKQEPVEEPKQEPEQDPVNGANGADDNATPYVMPTSHEKCIKKKKKDL